MALFEQRGSSWRVRIKRKGYAPVTKTFDKKAQAEAWAREIESGMDRGITSPGLKPSERR